MSQHLIPIPKEPLRFCVYVSRSYRRWALLAIAAVGTAVALESTLLYIIKLLVDSVNALSTAGDLNIAAVLKWTILYPAISLVISLAWRCSGFCGQRWLTGVESATYQQLFNYLTGHSSAYFQSRFAGALSNNISNAATGVLELLATTLWQFLPLAISFITHTFVAFLVHPLLALVFGGWLFIFLLINYFAVSRLSGLSYRTAATSSELRGRIVDTSSNIATVQQGGHTEFEQSYVGKYINSYRLAHLREWFVSEWVLVTNNLLLVVFIASMLGTALYLLTLGELTIGAVVLVISLLGSLYMSLLFISMHAVRAIGHYNKIKEGLGELLVPYDIVDGAAAADFKIAAGAVQIDNVYFAYPDNEVFSGLELKIPAGQRVGLVGSSGAGKSTLVNIILRQYEIQAGAVIIDGWDIRDVKMESLRKQIALVPQDISLFHRRIADNIRYGRFEADDQQVVAAARAALADPFIQELPHKYETFVGERGVKLSGGQRQRIAIARAFLKDSPILILDEATSALDSESEHAVQLALTRLFKGRTVIAIAHRLSTLREMDRIVVLEQGRIVEDGPHSALIALNGIYARLWQSQVKGFIN